MIPQTQLEGRKGRNGRARITERSRTSDRGGKIVDEGIKGTGQLSCGPMQRVERDTGSTGFHPGIFFGASYGARSCVNRTLLSNM